MGRKSLKDTRQKEIIEAFYQVAKKEGLEKTSIAKVAETLSINPSLVIHYFKTKLELEVGLVEYILHKYLTIYKSNRSIKTKDELLGLIDQLFSRKWNRLFNDGVFYSCYALIYRNNKFKSKFKLLHDELRNSLNLVLIEAQNNQIIEVTDTQKLTETIFALLEGAYYYLGLVSDKKENELKTTYYKEEVINLLRLRD